MSDGEDPRYEHSHRMKDLPVDIHWNVETTGPTGNRYPKAMKCRIVNNGASLLEAVYVYFNVYEAGDRIGRMSVTVDRLEQGDSAVERFEVDCHEGMSIALADVTVYMPEGKKEEHVPKPGG